MKKIILAAAIALLATTAGAKAEVVDVATIKCKEALAMSADELSYVLLWLHGYEGGKAGDTTIDVKALGEGGAAIGEKCGENPELGLLTVIEQMGN